MSHGVGRPILALTVVISLLAASVAAASLIETPAEASGYTRYTQATEIAAFLSHLDLVAPTLEVRIVGRSRDTPTVAALDMYLCVITTDGVDKPSDLDRSKPTIFFFASQHGDEQSAKEAALHLIRDLTIGALAPLLEQVNVLVMPQTNPYGNLRDQRRNEQDLDQNRDHVKLESPGVRAIHRVFREWMPEVTVDVHEKGDDYYRVSIGRVSNANIHESIQRFSRTTVLAEVFTALADAGIASHEYLITQRMGIDSSSGAAAAEEDEERELMKRFSTTDLNDGRNSLGIYETMSFIQEGASRADLETLRERTSWQYHGLRFLTDSVARHGEEILELVRGRRSAVVEMATTYSPDDLVHLRMEYVRDAGEPTLTITRFVEDDKPVLGVLDVDKRAGDPLFADDVAPPPRPAEQPIEEQVVENWFPRVDATLSVTRPLGYVIPAEHRATVDTMLLHGLHVDVLLGDAVVDVEAYRVVEVVASGRDYLAPEALEVEAVELQQVVKAGDFYVSCAQTGANLIPNLLEPQAQYGFIRYLRFGLIPETGEVFPFFRVIQAADLRTAPYKRWTR